MPDLIGILNRRWKIIATLTLIATLLALIISLIRPKEYASTVTALPSNSLTTDKARIFNTGIEALYPEVGTPDELDRIEGSAKLDTIFLVVADSFNLATHYTLEESGDGTYRAAQTLKQKADIRRSAYGELKIKVWDGDAALAAQLANALLDALNGLHQHVQTANNVRVLERLKTALVQKQQLLDSITTGAGTSLNSMRDTFALRQHNTITSLTSFTHLQKQITEYQRLISEYELAMGTMPQALIVVEQARPSLLPDRPKVLQTVLFAFGASFLFSFLLAAYTESRYQNRHDQ